LDGAGEIALRARRPKRGLGKGGCVSVEAIGDAARRSGGAFVVAGNRAPGGSWSWSSAQLDPHVTRRHFGQNLPGRQALARDRSDLSAAPGLPKRTRSAEGYFLQPLSQLLHFSGHYLP
jgi:hypothetical protein